MKKDGGLRDLFRQHLPHFHWVTIENTFMESGIPDNNYCYAGRDGWVEFKTTAAWALGTLKQEQVVWHERRTRAGGRVFIAVRRADDELWIFAGSDAQRLKTHGMRGVTPLYKGAGGTRQWDWRKIESVLTQVIPQPQRKLRHLKGTRAAV